jgi:EF hand
MTTAGALLWAAPASTEDLETLAAARMRENAAKTAAMMDRNRDGWISQGEFLRHNADMGRFAELDVDRDGGLSAEEQNAVTVGPRILRR